MSASTPAEAVPLVPETDDAASQSWMYRSEAFAEDLDETPSTAAQGTSTRTRQTLLRLTLPLSALMFGAGLALVYGLQ